MRIYKNNNLGKKIDPKVNSLNYCYTNCVVYSKENGKFDLGAKGLSITVIQFSKKTNYTSEIIMPKFDVN